MCKGVGDIEEGQACLLGVELLQEHSGSKRGRGVLRVHASLGAEPVRRQVQYLAPGIPSKSSRQQPPSSRRNSAWYVGRPAPDGATAGARGLNRSPPELMHVGPQVCDEREAAFHLRPLRHAAHELPMHLHATKHTCPNSGRMLVFGASWHDARMCYAKGAEGWACRQRVAGACKAFACDARSRRCAAASHWRESRQPQMTSGVSTKYFMRAPRAAHNTE